MTIQINLMSEQLLPNVIPTLSQGVDNIEKIYLVLAGNLFKSHALLLKSFYEKKGIKEVSIFHCADANDYYALRAKADELYKNIKVFYPDAYIALNATGGTKPMSIAFTQVFDRLSENSMALYTDTANKKVIILNDADNIKDLPYLSVLSIDEYFSLYNFTVDSSIAHHDHTDNDIIDNGSLSKSCLSLVLRNKGIVGKLNSIAQTTNFGSGRVDRFVSKVTLHSKIPKPLSSFFKLAEIAGLLTLSLDCIEFRDADVARYLGGGWIEELIYLAAIEAGITEVALNVEGHQPQQAKNELDVVLLNNNQMLLIEAKTLNWSAPQNKGKGQDTVLKLESLTKNFGGLYAKGMIVTLYPLTSAMQDRLADMRNINAFCLKNYSSLVDKLRDWKSTTEE